MNQVKIFLDDFRYPDICLMYMYPKMGAEARIYLEDWIIVKNYEEFKQALIKNIGNISHISFDHDLADIHYQIRGEDWTDYTSEQLGVERTGYDCALLLLELYKEKDLALPITYCHSQNPISYRISNLFK